MAGEVEVDFAFDVEADVDRVIEVDLEFILAIKFALELGRSSPSLSKGGNNFSFLNFIPNPIIPEPRT